MKTENISHAQNCMRVVTGTRSCVYLLLTMAAMSSSLLAQQYQFKRLNPPGSAYSFAFGVNNNDVVAGSFTTADGTYEGFIYEDGKYKIVIFPGAVGFTQASAINDSNTVAGEFTGSDSLNHGYLLDAEGRYTQYDVTSGASTNIYGINNAGNFTGNTSFQGETVMGFVNIEGSVTTFTFKTYYTFAFGINNANETVGYFTPPPFAKSHGFFRDASGKMTQIDYPGATTTVCLAINDLEEITGYYVDSSNVAHGFLLKNNVFRSAPLPDLAGINNEGVIVGGYTTANQANYGYIATPTNSQQ